MTSSPRGKRQRDCIFWSGNPCWQTHKHGLVHAKQTLNVALLECVSAGTYQHMHPSSTHSRALTKPQVYDRWRRLIASALHHEWQQEVMNALLYGGRGNGHVGYLSSALKPFPVSHLHRISIPIPFLRNVAAHLSVGFLISFFPHLFLPSHHVLWSVLSVFCIWDL